MNLPPDWIDPSRFEHRGGKIPRQMCSSIRRYVLEHKSVGSFLTAVFSNNFMDAVSNADDENVSLLDVYAKYVYNHVPGDAWGSPEKVAAWLAAAPPTA